MYVNRHYRNSTQNKDLHSFKLAVKETDLFISIDKASYSPELEKNTERLVLGLRYDLEEYIKSDPEFRTTLKPHSLLPGAPLIAVAMAAAANRAGVGPMAAVAGAFAEFIGRELMKYSSEIIVENGGDIFIASKKDRHIAIFAGTSPFSNRIALVVPSGTTPLGVCTSSGTVGPSLSLGVADAAVIVAATATLADAAASSAGNLVKTPKDVKKAVNAVKHIDGILGAVVIKGDQLAAWGDFEIVPI